MALSEVSPSPLSHDTVSRWLKSRCFRPKDLWRLVEPSIDKKSPCVLIADDTLIAKTRSRKIEMVHYQYSGNKHDVIAGHLEKPKPSLILLIKLSEAGLLS
ncbi:hypothetical protein CBG25_15430 [Arsenophonus sp. ENCA]|nr:hypothetical protein CBG25_19135 [Arsenophonus sp. ENCA]PAV01653.1 hypothetical protein CBG25_15430 [Arsenophonus sp. ENCA]